MKLNTDAPSFPAQPQAAALREALSDAALRRAGGDAIFQRGQRYAASGAVRVTKEQGVDVPRIFATVTGTESYRTEVWVRDHEVDGACDCPSAHDTGFCKHQVALALVWRARLGGEAAVPEEVERQAAKAPARRGEDKRQALHDFLHGLDSKVLAERLMQLADGDRAIARDLQQWRLSSDVPENLAEAKARVTQIMSPGQSFIAWNEGRDYVRRAEAVLPLLAKAREREAKTALALCLHAMRRGWAVLEQADDSDGDVGNLVSAIGAEWVAALGRAGPQPAAFGDTYLQLLLDDPFGCFDTAAAEAAMGEAALLRFREALARRWREADAGELRWSTLEQMYLAQLEAVGDVDGALAVLRRNLSEPWDYCRVTAFLERHGRLREAFAHAELAHRAHPDNHRVQEDLLRCYERDGWVDEAFSLRRRQWDSQPGVDTYLHVLAAGQAAGRDRSLLRDELHAELVALEASEVTRDGARDVTLRAVVLCAEDRWQEAVAVVQPPAHCDERVLAALARQLGPGHAAQRIELLMRVFSRTMRTSSSPYREALALVAEIGALLDPPRQAAWLARLRADYKAKRNFVRDLPGA